MNGPIVRRVLSPEQEAAEKQKHNEALAARMAGINSRHAQHPTSTSSKKKKKHQ